MAKKSQKKQTLELAIIPPKLEIDLTSSVRKVDKNILTGRKSHSVSDSSYRPKKKKKSEKKLLLTRRTKK